MFMQWGLFVVATIVTYIGISLFAQLSGGSSMTAWQAFFSAVRPLPLVVMIVANMFFALAIYYGFTVTRYTIPIAIAMGAMTSFVYSVVFLGANVTAVKIGGIALIIVGIALLGL